jgi:hypothetical protein
MRKTKLADRSRLAVGQRVTVSRFHPVAVQPCFLGFESLTATSERPQAWACQGREVREPALPFRLDVAGTTDGQLTQTAKVDLLALKAVNPSLLVNQQMHG